MTSSDRGQVIHVVNVLSRIAALADPIAVVRSIVTVIEAVAVPPAGDPARCRGLAAAFRAAGGATTPIAADVRRLATGTLPASWGGSAGAGATRVVGAAADLLDGVAPAFAVAASGLEGYATTVEGLRRRHGELNQRLREIWHDATHIRVFGREVDMVDLAALSRLAAEAVEVVGECLRVYRDSLSAADELEGHLADCRGRARAARNVAAGNSPVDAVVLAGTRIGGAGGDRDSAILTPAQAARIAELRGRLSAEDRARLDALLAGASSPEERAYLLKTFAAGHSVADLAAFDAKIRGRSPEWLRAHLSLVDPGVTGTVTFNGRTVEQYDGTTCGSTSIVMALAMTDPLYAFQLTTGGDPDAADPGGDAFFARLKAEEQRTHDSTNTVWPQALGTSPWGVSGELNDHAAQVGTEYDWRLVDDTDGRSVDPALSDAVRAVDAGHPVPVLIGDSYPRHYVLMIGHDGDDLLFYNPSGEVTRVSERDFRDGDLSALGFDHVQGVIVPKSG